MLLASIASWPTLGWSSADLVPQCRTAQKARTSGSPPCTFRILSIALEAKERLFAWADSTWIVVSCRNQAIAQLCAFRSPFRASVSDMAMYHQLGEAEYTGAAKRSYTKMSKNNGDKARFHRNRKKKIARRKQKRELLALTGQPQPETPPSRSKPGAANL
jgi:hypothetical protein